MGGEGFKEVEEEEGIKRKSKRGREEREGEGKRDKC